MFLEYAASINNILIKISNLSFRVSGIVLLRGDTEQEPHGSGEVEEEDRSVTVPEIEQAELLGVR